MELHHVHQTVHTLRQKPLHVRENITLGVAGGVTALVALAWFFATLSSGTFSLAPSSFASTESPNVSKTVVESTTNFTQLLGAAGAAISASSSPAAITIVDTKVNSTLDQQTVPADATVIHF